MEPLLDIPPLGYHIAVRPIDQRVIVKDAGDRRVAARAVMEQGAERKLLNFGIADTHVHALVLAHRDAAGRFAHDLETSLRWRLRIPVPFERAMIRPVRTQRHLTKVYWYEFEQEQHHGTMADPTHDGTSLLDVLGGRALLVPDGKTGTRRLGREIGALVATALPRVRARDLLARVGGLAVLEAPIDLEDLAEAAAAAVGARDLRGNGPVEAAALRAAVHAAASATTAALADALQVSRRAVQRYRSTPPDPAVQRAVEIQWRLRGHRREQTLLEGAALLALPEARLD
jgi:hypothetical protein